KPWLGKADNRRMFVIISDAFRYEAAEELTRDLNGKYRFEATLSSQLGVLPSYTALGMASLLPHRTLEYQDNGTVLADGKSTASIDQRGLILASVKGLALRADELIALKKEDGRALVADSRVVYIYHNIIDSVGDSASTEDRTFAAVRRTIVQLAGIVRYVIDNLNGNFVLITADHGFLFTESGPDQTDKSSLGDKPDGTVIAKKRYLLGRDLGDHPAALHGFTKVTAGAEGGMEFWIPKGTNRFHFAGGAKYFHGGAMPQEVVVPVITVRHRKDKGTRGKTATKFVPVHVLGAGHKITTSRHRFELLQMESAGDRIKPVTLKIAVYDGDTPVTNVDTVTFDSTSESLDDRRKWVTLTLQDREFDKRRPYRLVLQEADTGIEHEAVDVIIDRAFTDDF
ncbi:MAG: BREX-1 system phosphatase PglZ type A, partial [Planctomycetes bacterium]|nr:BREX-1 system phosphatase PglZ type A [Planctomycetota bacterium]